MPYILLDSYFFILDANWLPEISEFVFKRDIQCKSEGQSRICCHGPWAPFWMVSPSISSKPSSPSRELLSWIRISIRNRWNRQTQFFSKGCQMLSKTGTILVIFSFLSMVPNVVLGKIRIEDDSNQLFRFLEAAKMQQKSWISNGEKSQSSITNFSAFAEFDNK